MTDEIRHIVFDIGKVLIHYDPHLAFAELIPDDAERAWFFENICTHDWNIEQDRGRSWAEAEELLIAEHPDREHHIRAFRQNWHKMVPHAYEDSVAILDKFIDDGWDVTLLTNFADDTLTEAKERFPFLKKPRGVTVSAQVGLLKPDPQIYDLHTKTFDLDPKASIFFDDSLPNVLAARDYGWKAIHFTNADALRRDLKDYGIEV
jgi:2-haloacid dehalogenase